AAVERLAHVLDGDLGAGRAHPRAVTAYRSTVRTLPTVTVTRNVTGIPRELGGQMTKSRNTPRNGRRVTFRVVLPYCTACTPPSGSTICTVMSPAAGLPWSVTRTL